MCSVCHNKSCLSLTEKLHQKYTILNRGSTSGLKSTLLFRKFKRHRGVQQKSIN